jgi:hypothetical protein
LGKKVEIDMRILFVTTFSPDKQGDLLEVSLLHGLRSILGDNLVDYPKKKIMYHDFSESPKETLHGRGFSLLTTPISDVSNRDIMNQKYDFVLYGDGHMYGEYPNLEEVNKLADGNVWIIDGHDLYGNAPRKIYFNGEEIIGNQFTNCFKRELIEEEESVYPTGFGIPEERILPIDLGKKDQLYQKTAPSVALFGGDSEMGGGFSHHKFDKEDEYYNDLSRSWFGLTCKKGGWDCLRHYEIIAAGSLLLFKDYDSKPPLCSPQNLPCFSYSTPDELYNLMSQLVVDGKPTSTYLDMLNKQRVWLYNCGTTVARARYIVSVLNEFLVIK